MQPQDSTEAPVVQADSMPQAAPIPLQYGRFRASWMITKESWEFLVQDKEMMWIPILSFVTSLIVLALFGGLYYLPLLINGVSAGDYAHSSPEGNYIILALAFGYLLTTSFFVNFYEASIYFIVHGRINGQNLSLNDGLRAASASASKIFVWSAISATVGFVLRMISDRSKWLGRLVAWMLGAAWNIMTYFTLPALVVGGMSVKDAMKTSVSVIHKNWGETVIIKFGVGLFIGVVLFLAIGVSALGFIFAVSTDNMLLFIAIAVTFFVFLVIVSVVSSVLNAIFKLALYEYASTGKIPEGFSPELLQHAVEAKK